MSAVANHLFDEVMKEFKRSSGSDRPIAEAFDRQQPQILAWLEESCNTVGVSATVDFLNNAIEMNKNYSSVRPFFNDLVELSNDLLEKGIDRETPDFRAAIVDVSDNHKLNTFDMTPGGPVVRENLNQLEVDHETPHPYREAFDLQKERYDEATRLGDTETAAAAGRVLDVLIPQIKAYDAAAAKPEEKPVEPAPSVTPPGEERGYVPSDEHLDRDIQRGDAIEHLRDRIESLSDAEYSPENAAELAEVNAELAAIDADLGAPDESTHIAPDGSEVFD